MAKGTKNIVLTAAAVVLLAFAAYRLVGWIRAPSQLPSEYSASAVCLNCKAQVAVQARIADRPPYKCPKCGDTAVYPWLYCAQCKKRLIPELARRSGAPPRFPMVALCPGCGAEAAAWIQGDESQPIEGADLPLPAWP